MTGSGRSASRAGHEAPAPGSSLRTRQAPRAKRGLHQTAAGRGGILPARPAALAINSPSRLLPAAAGLGPAVGAGLPGLGALHLDLLLLGPGLLLGRSHEHKPPKD